MRPDQRSPEAQEWRRLYRSKRWRAIRPEIYARDLGRCRMCDAVVGDPYTIDHVRPHKGDLDLFFDEANLQLLCPPCHDSRKQRAEALGYEPGCDASGRPVDPRHPWNAS